MQRKRKISLAKAAVILGIVPVLLWAYEYGPNPGYSGVPGEHDGATCDTSGCHVGTPLNAGGGSVTVTFPNGMTYTPGVTQHLKVTIADKAQRAWGFELTARQASSTSTAAGSFASTDNHTQLVCSHPDLFIFVDVPFSGPGSQSCDAGSPLQYIEHSLSGYNATKGTTGSATYEFDWTPPASNVGNITIYVAGNAANGDLQPTGDHIYSATYPLTPAASGGPTITGVSNAAGGQPGVVADSFVSIYGSGFTTLSYDDWSNSISSGQLPTKLDGVSVTIGGMPAYIYQISPGQINAQAPDVGTGSISVTVTNANGTSAAFTTTAQPVAPAFWPWPNNQPVATHNDFTIAAKNGTFSGQTTIPAKPGEVITLWGTGFGLTTAGGLAGQVPGNNAGAKTATPVSVMLDGTGVQVLGAALSPYPGDYQIAIQIPASMANGDHQLMATMNGVSSPAYTLTVQQ
jgi:uncharacterized protein (TIGR03437 family)